MQAAMIFFAVLCIGLGVYPDPLYAILPYAVDYVPYTAEHVIKMLQLLLFSGLAFFLLLGMMKRTLTITLDVDWFYRRLGVAMARRLGSVIAAGDRKIREAFLKSIGRIISDVNRHHGPDGLLARTHSISTMVNIMLALLFFYLLLYFI